MLLKYFRQSCTSATIVGKFQIAAIAIIGVMLVNYGDNKSLAQIVPDRTLGSENSIVTPNAGGVNTITGGATRGTNLFHSFERFSVPTGGTAYFNNALSIQNIFSRVTGGEISNIDGLLQANGTANLFLLNPNGIIFGQNAALNIGGSFLGSTASSVKFADGTEFSAIAPETKPLLTISVPIGLQVGETARQIQVNGSGHGLEVVTEVSGFDSSLGGLRVQPGKNLALVGGDVSLNGGILQAPSGKISLGGLAGTGTIGLNNDGSLSFPAGVAQGDVSIANKSGINVLSDGGGSIAINARNLDVSGNSLLTAGIESGKGAVGSQAGDITLNTTGAIRIDLSRIENNSNPSATGNSGNINIQAGALSVTNNAAISASTFGTGNSGNINIQAGALSVTNNAAISADSFGMGNSGNINIQAGALSVTNNADISADTVGRGNGGSIAINVRDTVSLNEGNVFSRVGGKAVGNAGNIKIAAHDLSVINGAELQAVTFGGGNAGSVRVNVRDTINISGVSPQGYSSGLFSGTESGASGLGGGIEVQARTLRIADGGVLQARSQTAFSGGNIIANVNTLELTDGGQILTTAFFGGNAGNININATDGVTISGTDPTFAARLTRFGEVTVDSVSAASGIFADTKPNSTGIGGSIFLSTTKLTIRDGGGISVNSHGTGNGGNLQLTATESINLAQQASLDAETANGEGGNLTLKSGNLLLLRNDSLISAKADNSANGGNITIDAPLVVAVPSENSDIIATAVRGRGGNINITSQSIFGLQYGPSLTPKSDINASSEFGINGEVEINTPGVDPSQGLTTLPKNLVNIEALVPQGCKPAGGEGESKFIVTGKGGLPPNPTEPLNGDTVLANFETPSTPQGASLPKADTATAVTPQPATANSQPQLVEATGWLVNEKGQVVLVANAPKIVSHTPWQPATTCKPN